LSAKRICPWPEFNHFQRYRVFWESDSLFSPGSLNDTTYAVATASAVFRYYFIRCGGEAATTNEIHNFFHAAAAKRTLLWSI
jgi:hypothetical protein